jgi:hypothetical protein
MLPAQSDAAKAAALPTSSSVAVDAAGLRGDGVGVLVDCALVERVDLRRLGLSARGADLRGHRLERRPRAAGEEHRHPLTSERTRVSSRMDSSSASVAGDRALRGAPLGGGGSAACASVQSRVVSESMATVIARMSGASSPAATSTP